MICHKVVQRTPNICKVFCLLFAAQRVKFLLLIRPAGSVRDIIRRELREMFLIISNQLSKADSLPELVF